MNRFQNKFKDLEFPDGHYLESVLTQGRGVNKDDEVPLRPLTRNVNFLEKMILPIALPETFYR